MRPIAFARHAGMVCLLLAVVAPLSPAAPRTRKSKPKTVKDLEQGSKLPSTVRFPKWTVSKVFKLLEARTGNRMRCVKDTFSGEEDRPQLNEKISVGVRNATFWKVVDAVAKAAKLEVLGVNDRRLVLIDAGKLTGVSDIRSAGAPVARGAFLVKPESIQKNLFVRVRPEPWIGLPYLQSYKLSVTRGDGTTAEQAPREFAAEMISTTAEELYLPVSAETLKGSRRVAKVDLEAKLVVATVWEKKSLGTFEELLDKPQDLGKVIVTVTKAEIGVGPFMGSKAVYVELGVEKYFLPKSSVTIVDRRKKTLKVGNFAQSPDGTILLRFDINEVDEIKTYRLEIEAPTETIEYTLRATLEDLVIR